MKINKTLLIVTITALLTGVAVKACGDFCWNIIASLVVVVLLTAIDHIDAKS